MQQVLYGAGPGLPLTRLVGAIDIGGTGTKLAIVQADGVIRSRAVIPTSAGGEPVSLVESIADALTPLLAAARAEGHDVNEIGVAVAGFLDREHSAMYDNANLPALCDYPLGRALEARLGMRCRLEVDSNAALVAEYRHGAARGAKRVLGVTIGTGLGGAVMTDGTLLRHTGECAGDLGHIILDPDGPPCSCGARGCLEALVSAGAVSERAGGRTVRDVIAAAGAGERVALDALGETGWWLGVGLAALSPLFAPERIVVGGGVAAAGEGLLEAVRASYAEHAAPAHVAGVRVAGSAFGGWEGVVGAASLVFDPPD